MLASLSEHASSLIHCWYSVKDTCHHPSAAVTLLPPLQRTTRVKRVLMNETVACSSPPRDSFHTGQTLEAHIDQGDTHRTHRRQAPRFPVSGGAQSLACMDGASTSSVRRRARRWRKEERRARSGCKGRGTLPSARGLMPHSVKLPPCAGMRQRP